MFPLDGMSTANLPLLYSTPMPGATPERREEKGERRAKEEEKWPFDGAHVLYAKTATNRGRLQIADGHKCGSHRDLPAWKADRP
jgi:hypothetical protein